ncbi:MAG TPA: hypothetical protein VGL10_03965, partial [Gammaproteobacteria bacterium]
MQPETPDPRLPSPLDRILAEFDQALRTAWVPGTVRNRASPAAAVQAESALAESERALSEGLM